jgi:sec-independent protein translocase protein TatA
MPNIGPTELIIVLVIALLILGPKRLPDAGRSIGSAVRGFKDSVSGKGDTPALPDEQPKEPAASETGAARVD